MVENTPQNEYYARAFVSCSLRAEDKPFVDFICSILEAYHIKPFGTVGKFCAAPENPVVSMKENIKDADIVVICATPRYTLKDIHTSNETNGLSEMIHVETGMALSAGKPVVAFVKKGTNVGCVIPNITQYVELTGEVRERDKNTGKYKEITKTSVVWPRYHQLDAVRCLLKATKDGGVGHRFLIQHSAGSGKSNSITWLAYQLVGLLDGTQPLLDSVIVVTDRVRGTSQGFRAIDRRY